MKDQSIFWYRFKPHLGIYSRIIISKKNLNVKNLRKKAKLEAKFQLYESVCDFEPLKKKDMVKV